MFYYPCYGRASTEEDYLQSEPQPYIEAYWHDGWPLRDAIHKPVKDRAKAWIIAMEYARKHGWQPPQTTTLPDGFSSPYDREELLKESLTEVYRALVAEFDYGESNTLSLEAIERRLMAVGVNTDEIREELDKQFGVESSNPDGNTWRGEDDQMGDGGLLPVGTKIRLLFSVNSFVTDPERDEFFIPSGTIGEIVSVDESDEHLPYYVRFDLTGMGLPLPEDTIWLFVNDIEPV